MAVIVRQRVVQRNRSVIVGRIVDYEEAEIAHGGRKRDVDRIRAFVAEVGGAIFDRLSEDRSIQQLAAGERGKADRQGRISVREENWGAKTLEVDGRRACRSRETENQQESQASASHGGSQNGQECGAVKFHDALLRY